MTTDVKLLENRVIRKAIEALHREDARTWLSLFAKNAVVYDHGNAMTAWEFIEKSAGHEHFASIDKTENKGLVVFGHFHSEQLGEFQACFRFQLNEKEKVSRLDVVQTLY